MVEQESRTDCRPDPRVAEELLEHVLRVLPGLRPEDVLGEYVSELLFSSCAQ